MNQIYEQTQVIKQILPKQKIEDRAKYRKFFYLSEYPVEDGILLFNTLTYELVFLSCKENEGLKNPDLENETVCHLIEGYFLVPEDFDDKKLATQIINTRLQIQNIYRNVPYSYFVILPTTGCNARCFYCFEAGAKVSNMTEQTAHDVASFIERKGAEKVKIQWFGGEPLVNQKAIDIICKDLTQKNIEFTSIMVSNGYLLDENVIKKAVDLWKLERVQITLDGTEKVYNKVKNYVYVDVGSPFVKVLNNIENCLKANIQVRIRLNMDEHNEYDLFELSKTLVKKFSKYNNCYIYTVRLFEDTCDEIKNREVKNRHKLIDRSINLQKFIDENMPKQIFKDLPKAVGTPNTCMACSDNSVMIVPDGHLGKCEHYVDTDFFGSIYSEEKDIAKIQRYKERTSISERCNDCELMSLCQPLKCCSAISNHCDNMDKMATINRLHSRLRNIYNAFLENQNKNR